MLYGCANITVYTDHKNNTFTKFSTQRVLRWRLILEGYGVHFQYIPGVTNTLADALSRLPIAERQDIIQEDLDSHFNQFNCSQQFPYPLRMNVLPANTVDDSL